MRPIPGSVYQVVRSFMTMAGKCYEPGMQLELYEETSEAPFGHESKISNWIVKCPFFAPGAPESIWSSIWMLIEKGYLERVAPDADRAPPTHPPGPPWTIVTSGVKEPS